MPSASSSAGSGGGRCARASADDRAHPCPHRSSSRRRRRGRRRARGRCRRRARRGAAASVIRSTSTWMNDSRPRLLASRARGRSSVPSAARSTPRIGWMIRCSVRPWRLTSIVTESTRNGMSSLTISMIVCVDCQPCSSIVGLKTRTLGAPALALAREVPVRERRAVQVGGLPLGQVLRGRPDRSSDRRASRSLVACPAPPSRAQAPRPAPAVRLRPVPHSRPSSPSSTAHPRRSLRVHGPPTMSWTLPIARCATLRNRITYALGVGTRSSRSRSSPTLRATTRRATSPAARAVLSKTTASRLPSGCWAASPVFAIMTSLPPDTVVASPRWRNWYTQQTQNLPVARP